MSTVPYTFANASGNIALSELDANFSNVKTQVDSANVVSDAAQPAITSVGTLTALTVSGNITTGTVKSSNSLTVLSGGSSNFTQLQWATDVATPGTGQNQYLRLDTNGAQIRTSSSNYTWQFNTNGTTSMPGNVSVTGNVNVSSKLAVTGNAQIAGIFSVGSYLKATLNTITGSAGSMAAVLDSPTNQGRIAYWDLTFNRWSYIDTNGPV